MFTSAATCTFYVPIGLVKPFTAYAGPKVQPQYLTEMGVAQSMIGPAQGLGIPHALN